ncbi:MAG: hypothetical protein AW06_001737 [Candidatus Accumulibacter cognatus]|uniref:Uncharacterized protein n=1 Tax=Candidatus Accumulibacter cognatus TaxID=2954383 RepID=A0A080M886_9PROT|nr:MAG: hypothetical protein AW06_001737 [Candidatus Accumulibacter cognatus]
MVITYIYIIKTSPASQPLNKCSTLRVTVGVTLVVAQGRQGELAQH